MAVQGINHFAITVTDMDRSLDFYTRLFGFEDSGVRLDLSGPFIETLQDIPGASLRAAVLRLSGLSFELLCYDAPAGHRSNPLKSNDVGSHHLCFTVDSVDDEYERLVAEGVRFMSPPLDYQGGIRAVYFMDPDGNMLEMLSRAPS
jgi:catechol 2,3-dioxygenase-like lactoylglutathione lyase family enzyme